MVYILNDSNKWHKANNRIIIEKEKWEWIMKLFNR